MKDSLNPTEIGDVCTEALLYAVRAHDSIQHRRKYNKEPYVTHPIRVESLVRNYTTDWKARCAAFLHDVIEDVFPLNPQYSLKSIQDIFGDGVSDLVRELTDVYTPEYFPQHNRAARKKLEAERLREVSETAQLVKLCDLLDNTSDIVSNAPLPFARLYLQEKAEMLKVLDKPCFLLRERVRRQLEEAQNKISPCT